MNREMQVRIKENKQRAAELISFANPKSKNRPTIERVTEIISRHIPYRIEKPVIINISIISYKNNIIKSAYFRIETADKKSFRISAYQQLTGKTPEQREEDKTADFPSRLFNIFTDEIKEKSITNTDSQTQAESA